MLQSLRNIWDIPDLRKRVLFTLGMLAVYRFGNHIPTPGINTRPHRLLRAEPGQLVRPRGHVLGRQPRQGHDLRPRDHALHLGLHHPAAPHRGLALPGEALQGGRARQAQDHAVHPLRNDAPVRGPVPGHRRLPRADDAQPDLQGRGVPGLELQAHDRAHPHHGHGLHHVAGRADHRPRHRQRDEPHHLRGDRGGLPRGPPRHLPHDPARGAEPPRRPPPRGHDGGGDRGHRLRGARPAPHPRPVRQARGGAAHVRADRPPTCPCA